MVYLAWRMLGWNVGFTTMGRGFGIVATVIALASAGVAGHAYAQSTGKQTQPVQAFNIDPNVWQPANQTKSLQWNGNGRWGLKLDYQQPSNRDLQGRDVDVGASYRVNRRLRLVGSVNVGGDDTPRFAGPDERPQPRVRL